jgi:hypothetical protein
VFLLLAIAAAAATTTTTTTTLGRPYYLNIGSMCPSPGVSLCSHIVIVDLRTIFHK